MADNNSNRKYNGNQNVEEAGEYDKSSIEIIIESTNNEKHVSLEENKQKISEKAKLAKRAKLSDEDRRKLNNERARQRRANLSDEDREKINQSKRQRQANLSEEERSIIRERDAIQHRNKYHADKAFVKAHFERSSQHSKQSADENENDDLEDDEDKNQYTADEESRVNLWNLRREKRNAQKRTYRKAKYEQLKDAEEKLQAISNGGGTLGENDVQQLQLLANKRQQTLERARQYAQTYRQNNQQQRRWWVPIQQVWDEDNPCSYCGRVWLKSVKKVARVRCCFNGKAMDEESIWPKLQPLPNNIRQVIFGDTTIFISDGNGNRLVAHSPKNNIEHFSRNSARYNGVLSISATGIDNGKGGGWERIQGPHAVKLCGRTYHYLPRSNCT
eukprot:gene25564-33370_t